MPEMLETFETFQIDLDAPPPWGGMCVSPPAGAGHGSKTAKALSVDLPGEPHAAKPSGEDIRAIISHKGASRFYKPCKAFISTQ